ncbi:MAG TPA: hypothetical protein VFB21_08045 [Chthonomonadaceae bacterium]|jgi:DNA-binding HxlR family transcriptional regulator|nr:hypothetical protein [Chthonomonadaceae bacterium]
MTILDPNIRKRLEEALQKDGLITLSTGSDPTLVRTLQEAEEMEREGLVKRAEEQAAPDTVTYRLFGPTEAKPTVHDDSDR